MGSVVWFRRLETRHKCPELSNFQFVGTVVWSSLKLEPELKKLALSESRLRHDRNVIYTNTRLRISTS